MTAANKTVRMLTRYKAWANDLIFSMLRNMPYEEVIRPRQTRFGNMVHTLNHIYVIDAVFQAHLQGREHGYSARNTPSHPSLDELWNSVRTLDQWYVDFAEGLSAEDLDLGWRMREAGWATRGSATCHAAKPVALRRKGTPGSTR